MRPEQRHMDTDACAPALCHVIMQPEDPFWMWLLDLGPLNCDLNKPLVSQVTQIQVFSVISNKTEQNIVLGPVLGNLSSQPGADDFLLRRQKRVALLTKIIYVCCSCSFTFLGFRHTNKKKPPIGDELFIFEGCTVRHLIYLCFTWASGKCKEIRFVVARHHSLFPFLPPSHPLTQMLPEEGQTCYQPEEEGVFWFRTSPPTQGLQGPYQQCSVHTRSPSVQAKTIAILATLASPHLAWYLTQNGQREKNVE